MIKKILQYGLFVVLVLGTVLVWKTIPVPCATPIEYALGRFDNRFGISQEDFLREASAAERVWESALGRELFRFAPEAVFKINLVFDERQERTLEGQKLESFLEKTKASQETLEQKQQKTRSLYEKTSREYERLFESFKRKLSAYNAEVEKWNREGGAPEDVYKDLEEVSRALLKEEKELETRRLEVNALAKEVNSFSAKQVAVVEDYNARVEEYTGRYGQSAQFDQGDYVGEEINIYQYDDVSHLRAVLVHEFGHALGFAHGSDPQSMMYYLMEQQSLDPIVLSSEDKAMLLARCNQTFFDVVFERIGNAKQWLTEHEDGKGFLGL